MRPLATFLRIVYKTGTAVGTRGPGGRHQPFGEIRMQALRRHRLTTAVQVSLLFGLPGFAAAQETTPAPTPAPTERPTTLETVSVTGTRIKRAEAEGQVPVQVLTREDIDRSGFTSVADIVQNLTASGSA